MRQDVEDTEKNMLRELGWRFTCAFPDSRWRWIKTLSEDKAIIATSSKEAIYYELRINR